MTDTHDDLNEAEYRAQPTQDLIDAFEFLSMLRHQLLHDPKAAADTAATFNGAVDVAFCDRRISLLNQILLERLPMRDRGVQ